MLRALALVKATYPAEKYDTDEEFARLYADALFLKQLEAKTLANEIARILSEG